MNTNDSDLIDDLIPYYEYKIDVISQNKDYLIYKKMNNTHLKEQIKSCEKRIKSFFNIKSFNINDIEYDTIFNSDDHGFQFPVLKIKIKNEMFVIKPKLADLEIEILKLFRNINDIEKSEMRLPVYKILNCNNFSIWEFINGETDKESITNVSKSSFLDDTVRNNLKFLNTVASEINLTDLHHENTLIKGNMVVPIDLEMITRGQVTGLYGEISQGEKVNISKEIDKEINGFNKKIFNLPKRKALIPTVILQDYIGGICNTTKLLKKLNDNIKKDFDKDIKINYNKLINYFEKCKEYQIIPYFIGIRNDYYFFDFLNNTLSCFSGCKDIPNNFATINTNFFLRISSSKSFKSSSSKRLNNKFNTSNRNNIKFNNECKSKKKKVCLKLKNCKYTSGKIRRYCRKLTNKKLK
jgi:hypothetical protein